MRHVVSKTVSPSPTVLSSSTYQSPGTLAAKNSSLDFTDVEKPVARDSNEHAASSSQVRQPDVNQSSNTGTHDAETTKNSIGTRLFPHSLEISSNNVDYLENVYSHVRRKLGRPPNDDMEQINVNMKMWDYLCPRH